MTRSAPSICPGKAVSGVAALLCAYAAPAVAQDISCMMEDGSEVAFIIDPSLFVTSVTPEEPIRRKVTQVRYGNARFPAEPFLIGDTRGFHGEGLGGTEVIFVTRPDGTALFVNQRAGQRVIGECEVRP